MTATTSSQDLPGTAPDTAPGTGPHTVPDAVPPAAGGRPRVLILGGGFIGLLTARHLQKRLSRAEVQIVLVDQRPYMTYQPFLPEMAAGSIESRHVVVPHRGTLKRTDVVTATVTGLRHADRVATVRPQEGEDFEIPYDHVVIGLGSVSRTFPIPGLLDEAIGFKSVEEASATRNQVLDRLDAAASMRDPGARRRALTVVVVGGGYAGIEVLAELEDLVRDAVAQRPDVAQEEVNFVLVEALGRILPEVGPEMGTWTLKQLRARGIDCRLDTQLKSCEGGHVVLSDGTEFDTDTIVWTAGVKSNPVLASTDLPLDKLGRLMVRADLRAAGEDGVVEGAWGAGDACAVPDLSKNPGDFCAPNAQHAVREAKVLGKNIAATLHGEPLDEYHHRYAGSVASLGVGKGVANIYGVKVKGYPAWLMHRGYHLLAIPTYNRKVRVLLDWVGGTVFHRDLVGIAREQSPREDFLASGAKPAPRLAAASGPNA